MSEDTFSRLQNFFRLSISVRATETMSVFSFFGVNISFHVDGDDPHRALCKAWIKIEFMKFHPAMFVWERRADAGNHLVQRRNPSPGGTKPAGHLSSCCCCRMSTRCRTLQGEREFVYRRTNRLRLDNITNTKPRLTTTCSTGRKQSKHRTTIHKQSHKRLLSAGLCSLQI